MKSVSSADKFSILRNEFESKEISKVIGCGDAITAGMAEEKGFKSVWASGLCICTGAGIPDAGILTMTELLAMTSVINRSTELPVIADCDTGFGDLDNVVHMVKEYENAGIAAVCIEDKCFPKTNSFMGKQVLAPIQEASDRIRVAKNATSENGLLIIARIEALISGAGMAEAIKRGIAYTEAGADAILIHSKSKTPDEIRKFCKLWSKVGKKIPIIVVPTTYYSITTTELNSLGVSVVIYANQPLRASVSAINRTLDNIIASESTAHFEKEMCSVKEVFDLIGMDQLKRHDKNNIEVSSKKIKQHLLLNPGPVMTNDAVKLALSGPDICHREEEFFEILKSCREKVVEICGGNKDYGAVILTGSGTAALESALVSNVKPGKKVLVLNNGNYGDRVMKILDSYATPTIQLDFGWGNLYDLSQIEDTIKSDSSIATIAMVHHETSTGMLNPLTDIGKISKKYSLELIVDCISSVGGDHLNVIDQNVDWCIGSSNKCIEGLPGLSFVCGPHKKFKSLNDNQSPGLYLNLFAHYNSQYIKEEPLFTPSIQIFFAFEMALKLLVDEGVENRQKRYKKYAILIRKSLKGLGMKFFISEEHMSNVLTVVYLPENTSYKYLHDMLKDLGFIIYSGKNDPNPVFRLANIGHLHESDIHTFLFELESIIKK